MIVTGSGDSYLNLPKVEKDISFKQLDSSEDLENTIFGCKY